MLHSIVIIILIFTVIIAKTISLDLCDRQNLISRNITEYKYKYESTDNCKCKYRNNCIRKCCAVGFYASKGLCLQYNETDHILKVPVYQNTTFVRNVSVETEILTGVMNCDFFPKKLGELKQNEFLYLQENGSLVSSTYGLLKNDRYCVDYVKSYGLAAFICYGEPPEVTIRRVNAAGMIISMPFLLATFIAYALLPDRNLHMKALMFYVIDLMFSYLFLVIIQLSNGKFSAKSCTALGYLCLFFFLASFFWMNVICIDIWFAFSGLRGFSGSKKSAERKRFYIYCAYASITPIVLILIIYSISALSETHSWYNPAIGEGQCFLRRGYPELLYFYGPMAIIITINITFFVITAIKIRRVKKDTSMLKKEDSKRHSYENDKQNFNLYLKLLFAMGVNWSMEVISWAVGWAVGKAPDAIWYLSDFCNAIYGVFIFFIFVFKKNIWKLLKKRYYSFIGRPHLAHSLSSQNTTRTTSGYSTATALHDNPNGTGLNDTTTLTSEA